ncbi:uncharacterized protein EV420DRAFT_1597153, partial [Desarmillaria tabescens]
MAEMFLVVAHVLVIGANACPDSDQVSLALAVKPTNHATPYLSFCSPGTGFVILGLLNVDAKYLSKESSMAPHSIGDGCPRTLIKSGRKNVRYDSGLIPISFRSCIAFGRASMSSSMIVTT